MQPRTLSTQEVARCVGVTAEDVAEWARLRLLSPDDAGMFSIDDLERARLLAFVTGRGLDAADVARVCATDGDVFEPFVSLLGGPRPPGVDLETGAAQANLDHALAQRVWLARGTGNETELFPEDVAAMGGIQAALDAGLPADALVQMTRVLADALGRVADAEVRLFHFYVHERLRHEGLVGEELRTTTEAATSVLQSLVEPAILYAHRTAFERAMRDDLLLHLAEDAAPTDAGVGRVTITVLFVDLAEFTPLSEAMGDAAVVDVLDRFSDLVRDHASRWAGRVVKQIGDEFMLVFHSPSAAVAMATALAAAAAAESHFPALRIGAHTGAAVFRESDYVGQTVNIAARVTAAAGRGQLVVTDEVRAGLPDDTVLAPLGRRALKGIAEPIDLFAVELLPSSARVVDPVCGMEMVPTSCDRRHAWNGTTWCFCSDACRELFLTDPDRYSSRAGER